jgi:hypothetical protein
MVKGCVGRDAKRLAVHATFAVGAEASLTITRVVLRVVVAAIVWRAVAMILTVVLRLRTRCTLLLGLLGLNLGLSCRVGCRVPAVLRVISARVEARLIMDASTTLGVLAQVVALLRRIIASEWPLLTGDGVLLSLSCMLLSVLLSVIVVGISILLIVVRGVVTRGSAESSSRLLRGRLRGGGRVVVKGGLRGWCVLCKRIRSLLGYSRHFLSSRMAESTVLLSVRASCLAHILSLGGGSGRCANRGARGSSLLGETFRDRSGLGDWGKRGTRVSNRRVRRRLSPSLRVLTISINILLAAIQVKGSELNSGPVDLTVTGHADSLFLV